MLSHLWVFSPTLLVNVVYTIPDSRLCDFSVFCPTPLSCLENNGNNFAERVEASSIGFPIVKIIIYSFKYSGCKRYEVCPILVVIESFLSSQSRSFLSNAVIVIRSIPVILLPRAK